MPDKDVFYRMTIEYYHLTGSEKKVADYVLMNKSKIQNMTISELALASKVAEATVTRFCRKIRCKSYNSFKIEIATSSSSRVIKNEERDKDVYRHEKQKMFDDIADSHIETIKECLLLVNKDNVIKAIDLICAADTVLCMGQGASMIMAQEAAHIFSTKRKNVLAPFDAHTQIALSNVLVKNDIVLYFSYSGSTVELLNMLELNKRNNIKTILVTRYPRSPGALEADVVLQCGSVEDPFRMGSIEARIAQLFVIDTLIKEYTCRYPKEAEYLNNKISLALTKRHL